MKQKLILVIIAAFATSFMIVPKTSAIKFRHIPFFTLFILLNPKQEVHQKNLKVYQLLTRRPKAKPHLPLIQLPELNQL